MPLRVHPALVETDASSWSAPPRLCSTAARGHYSPRRGRTRSAPRRGLAARDDRVARAGSSRVALERALAARVPVIGASLVLDLPRLGGALRGYPYEPEALERVARSPLRRAFRCSPGRCAHGCSRVTAARDQSVRRFAGPPSVGARGGAVRSVERVARRWSSRSTRSASVSRGRRRSSPASGRTRSSPRTSGSGTRSGSGGRVPRRHGGTAILVRPLRAAVHASDPAAVPHVLPGDPERPRPGRRCRGRARGGGPACDRGLPRGAHRVIRCCRSRTGTRAARRSTVSAPCSSQAAAMPAARQLGFVPTHGVGAALTWRAAAPAARTGSGSCSRRPYFPLRVGGASYVLAEVGLAHFSLSAQGLAASESAILPVSST